MIDVRTLDRLIAEIASCVTRDRHALDELRVKVRQLRPHTRRIQPHTTTAISLVGTDGGDNRVAFDPFMVQLIRVVDSSNNEYCLEAITPRSAQAVLNDRHVSVEGEGRTALGRMMQVLQVKTLHDLSNMIPAVDEEAGSSWVQVYRELTEWAVLLDLVRTRRFATDTVLIRDGFLRSKVFAGLLFRSYRRALEDAIRAHYDEERRRLYVVGIAKHSKIIDTYRLAMALEGILRTAYPAYVEVPRELQTTVYKWGEYAAGREKEIEGTPAERFTAGRMFFAKFGASPYDPVWGVDLLHSQVDEAPSIFGYLLADALDGFPVPFYPISLQRAHENAALADFDMQILEDQIIQSVREVVAEKGSLLDQFRLQPGDVSSRRYG